MWIQRVVNMEEESLNWFRFSNLLITVGTDVLHELLKLNIRTCSFSEYHKLWIEKVNLHSQSDGVKVLWSSLEQHYKTLDPSSQQSLQPLLSKWKVSGGYNHMRIRQQVSVLKTWEDDIQDFMAKHADQHATLKKWLSDLQSLATLNNSLLTLIETWTQEYVSLCLADQLNLFHLIDQHYERTKQTTAEFLNVLKVYLLQGTGELHKELQIFQQNEVNSKCVLKAELDVFLTSWLPKIDERLDAWKTYILSSPHHQILQTLLTDVKNGLPGVHQICKTELQDTCNKWHINLRTKLTEWNNQLQQVNTSTSNPQVLAKEWNDDLLAFPTASEQQTRDFFDSKKSLLQILKSQKIITASQWLLLYPTDGLIDLQKFDITLLSTLHRNIFPICPPELGWRTETLDTDHSTGADLMRLKKLRNDYIGHISNPTLTNYVFEKLWECLAGSLNRLSKALGHEFQETVNQKVSELKSCSFDSRREIKFQRDLINWYKCDIFENERLTVEKMEKYFGLVDQNIQTMIHDQDINTSEMLGLKTQMNHMMKGIQEVQMKMDCSATYASKGMERLETRITRIETILSNPKPNRTKLDNRIRLTRGRIEAQQMGNTDVHVKTRAFDNAKDILLEHKHLVVQGKPGDGKTYLALSLVADIIAMDTERQPVVIYDTNEWDDMVDMDLPLVVLLDDVLGKYGISETDLEQWKKRSELIQPNLSTSSIFLIVCNRTQIILSIKSYLQKNDAFNLMFNSHAIDIANEEHCLTTEEKSEMLMKYVPKYLDRNYSLIVADITEMENSIGFPEKCRIARSRQNLRGDLKDIFANNMFLVKEIEEISKKNLETYTFFVLLMLSGGSLCLENKNEELNYKIKIINEDCGLRKLNMGQVKSIGVSLCGTFVEYNIKTKTFKFQHDCIESAVFCFFGKDYPDVTLRLCSLKQLSKMCCVAKEFCCVEEEDFLNFKLMIDKDHFPSMYDRFNAGIATGTKESFKHISEALAWKHPPFVSYFANKICSVNDQHNFFSTIDPDGQSLLIYLIYAKNAQVVDRIITYITHCDIQENKFVARQLLLATTNACLTEENDLLKKLIELQGKVDDFVMFAAAVTGNVSLMKMLLLRGGNINATMSLNFEQNFVNGIKNCIFYTKGLFCIHGVTIFHIACSRGRTDMVKYLMTKFPELAHSRSTSGHTTIHFAVYSENLELVKMISAKPIDNSTDPSQATIQAQYDITARSNDGMHVLHIAACNKNFTIVKYLIETEPHLLHETDNRGWTALHYATARGSVPVIETLIQAGLDITARTNDSMHALHIAAENDNLSAVKYLIKTHSQCLQQTTNNGWTAVHYAAARGSVPVVETLMQAGMDITARTNIGWHVLHIAAINDNLGIVKHLIETQPQLLHQTDNDGLTAIHCAASRGSVPVIETLMQAGLDITTRTNNGKHVLHVAIENDNLTVVNYLIETQSQLLQQADNEGCTAVHSAAAVGSVSVIETLMQAGLDITARINNGKHVLHIAADKDKLTVVKYLIKSQSQLLQKSDNDGWTAVHSAAAGGSVHVIETLMQAGLDITARTSNGIHVLHIAAHKNNLTLVKYLIKIQSRLLQQIDNDGCTAVHYAAAGGDVPVIETLMQAGLDISAKNNNGKNVLHIAAEGNNLTVVEYLIETQSHLLHQTDTNGFTALHSAAACGSVSVIETLIQAGLDITALTNDNRHVLHIAAKKDNRTVVKYLIKSHSQLLQQSDKDGWTAVHYASEGGSVPMIETLMQAGLDIAARTNIGKHVLHIAVHTNNLTLVKYLIETQPRLLQQTDNNGWSAVHYAAAFGSVPVIETLKQAGLDITVRVNTGIQVLHIAANKDNLTVVKYLIETQSQLLRQSDKYGWTALHFAAAGGSVPVIETLMQAGLDITAKDNGGKHVLHIAAQEDNLTVVKYLIKTQSQLLQQSDIFGWTAVDYANLFGSVPMIETLLQAGSIRRRNQTQCITT